MSLIPSSVFAHIESAAFSKWSIPRRANTDPWLKPLILSLSLNLVLSKPVAQDRLNKGLRISLTQQARHRYLLSRRSLVVLSAGDDLPFSALRPSRHGACRSARRLASSSWSRRKHVPPRVSGAWAAGGAGNRVALLPTVESEDQ